MGFLLDHIYIEFRSRIPDNARIYVILQMFYIPQRIIVLPTQGPLNSLVRLHIFSWLSTIVGICTPTSDPISSIMQIFVKKLRFTFAPLQEAKIIQKSASVLIDALRYFRWQLMFIHHDKRVCTVFTFSFIHYLHTHLRLFVCFAANAVPFKLVIDLPKTVFILVLHDLFLLQNVNIEK